MGKMGREALGPRIGKGHKENVSYLHEDWEGAQIGGEALGPRIGKCHKENESYFNKD